MGLKDDILAEAPAGNQSALAAIFNELSEEDEAELRLILADPQIDSARIGRVLRRRGFKISDRAIQRYRLEHVAK